MSKADELIKFKELLDAGAITQEEFDAAKARILGTTSTAAPPVAPTPTVTQIPQEYSSGTTANNASDNVEETNNVSLAAKILPLVGVICAVASFKEPMLLIGGFLFAIVGISLNKRKLWSIISLIIAIFMTMVYIADSGIEFPAVSLTDNVSTEESTANDTAEVADESASDSLQEKSAQTKTKKRPKKITIDDTVTIDDVCEFSIDYINITADVMPLRPNEVYTHYEADGGKAYVDFCIAYTNLETSDVAADSIMSGTLTYADKYEYSGSSMIEESNRGNFTYTNITSIAPLTTEYIHYLFEVPEEVQTSTESIDLNMNIKGKDYSIVVRDESDDFTSSISYKTSGAVVTGETIETSNAKFSIDYSDITKVVMPESPWVGQDYYYYDLSEESDTYVDICFRYTNISNENVLSDSIITGQLRSNAYIIEGFCVAEIEKRKSFEKDGAAATIEPQKTRYVHYLFAVPDGVANDDSDSLNLTFAVDGNTYTYRVR